MSRPEVLIVADRVARRYGITPSAVLHAPDEMACLLDAAAAELSMARAADSLGEVKPMAVLDIGGL